MLFCLLGYNLQLFTNNACIIKIKIKNPCIYISAYVDLNLCHKPSDMDFKTLSLANNSYKKKYTIHFIIITTSN